jgi:hypothetical protein
MNYIRFGMCPFTLTKTKGVGIAIDGIASSVQELSHLPCMGQNCKMWIFKKDINNKIVAGCAVQLNGLTMEEIKQDIQIKEDLRSNICVDCKFYQVSFWGSAECKKFNRKTDNDSYCLEYEKKSDRSEALIKGESNKKTDFIDKVYNYINKGQPSYDLPKGIVKDGYWACPSCGNKIPEHFDICEDCGYESTKK